MYSIQAAELAGSSKSFRRLALIKDEPSAFESVSGCCVVRAVIFLLTSNVSRTRMVYHRCM